ncbi:MAG: hypothetical protein KDC35_02305 [Acidobacteria bacterium]|nr:hypothetical protein [Acidobacteriota bacterium]
MVARAILAASCFVFSLAQDGTKLVFPWVSKNAQFASIIFIHNMGAEPAAVTLTAHRALNGTGVSDAGPTQITIPPFGLFESPPETLFPSFGDGSGFAVIASSDSAELHGGWVTNNLLAGSGRSPSQGKAVRIDDLSLGGSPFVGQDLLYAYLPVTQGLTSALVVVNVDPQPLDVTLRFLNPQGLEVGSTLLPQLETNRPFAAVVNALVDDSQDNLMVQASAEGNITGVAFVFNLAAEPSIGNAVSIRGDQSDRLLMPWVSSNAQYESIVVVNNLRDEESTVRLTARRADGSEASAERAIPPFGFLEAFASDLFSPLGQGSGFSVTVTMPHSDMYGAWVTNNLETVSGRSPSQGNAIRLPPQGQFSPEVGPNLFLSYLPVTDGLTSAPVVVNVGRKSSDVALYFYGLDGTVTGQSTLTNVPPFQPFAAVANSLLDDLVNSYMVAQSSEPLTGVSFVFNNASEPSIGNGSAFFPQIPPGSTAKAQATIGTSGGELTDGSFVLTVPRNAFDGNYTLTLFEQPGSEKSVSSSYYISGLPVNFLRNLTVEAPVSEAEGTVYLRAESSGWSNEIEAEAM